MKFAPVFPAYAGMFLNPHPAATTTARFPRVRGDVPEGDLRLGIIV